ncbi:penicillin acylase family protein [Thermaurantiacus sp.]
MRGEPARASVWQRLGKAALALFAILMILVTAWVVAVWRAMEGSKPRLEGELTMAGLDAPVTITRDLEGVPTITGASRLDVAQALGYLHAQERFFQMETLRRTAAGELAAFLGPPALAIDRQVRRHRFRARARAMVAGMKADERAILDAYVAGVNAGLADLGGRPFEHMALLRAPEPWAAEDTLLAVFAMYLNLQPATPQREMDRARAQARGGRALADFLYPETTPLDAPLDGSRLPEPPMPEHLLPREETGAGKLVEASVPGSNNWAVSGMLSTSGAALVANDMHLGLTVPGTWYRARLVVRGELDATGVTLPGAMFVVAGSTGRIAWGFTNSYIDTADAVIVEETRPGFYRTPDGERPFVVHAEVLAHRTGAERLEVRETIWGPVVGTDALGRTIAMRWTAHAPDAVRLAPFLALEAASSVEEAIAIAHSAALPQQNLVVGDREGNIGWTIMGQVPARFGFDGRDAVSFADGRAGWAGMLEPGAVPVVMNPPSGRIWTANARVIGGNAYPLLGDGGYDTGGRAGRIRDLLFAKNRFAPADMLAIQLDDVSPRNGWWAALLAAEIARRPGDAKLQALRPYLAAWDGRAVPESVAFRLVDRFRRLVLEGLYEAWLGGKPEPVGFRRTFAPAQAEGSIRRVLDARPEELLPPGHAGWDAYLESKLAELVKEVGRDPASFTWGGYGVAGVKHPLARVLPFIGWVTDPPEVPVPGDRSTVRAQAPGFGASERFAVSPGHEAEGIFHMPGSQAGNPRAPYYLAGHQAWVEGRATPFLPGPPRWKLTLVPAGGRR